MWEFNSPLFKNEGGGSKKTSQKKLKHDLESKGKASNTPRLLDAGRAVQKQLWESGGMDRTEQDQLNQKLVICKRSKQNQQSFSEDA